MENAKKDYNLRGFINTRSRKAFKVKLFEIIIPYKYKFLKGTATQFPRVDAASYCSLKVSGEKPHCCHAHGVSAFSDVHRGLFGWNVPFTSTERCCVTFTTQRGLLEP